MTNQTTVARQAATAESILGGFKSARRKETDTDTHTSYRGQSPEEREAFIRTPEGAAYEAQVRGITNSRHLLRASFETEQTVYP